MVLFLLLFLINTNEHSFNGFLRVTCVTKKGFKKLIMNAEIIILMYVG